MDNHIIKSSEDILFGSDIVEFDEQLKRTINYLKCIKKQ